MYDTKGVEVFYVDGIKFHLDKKSGYYGGYFLKRKIRLHRYIWENIMVKFLKVIMFIIRIKTSLITTLIICKNQFTDNGFNKALFCSNKCKSKWRRLNGVDNEKRICLICGGEYECNKYDKTKTCSNRCGSILSQKTRKGESN